ncbi:MAG TPA: SRPBCC family protein [Lacunisphaera sp.]|nr:SRPBCC family protein [Lacunisphaera sp.]
MSLSVRAVVTRRFNASAGRVFDAWLDPAWIGRWMFGPNVREEQIVRLGCAARVGGEFSFVVARSGTEIDHVGEYLEIDRPHCLVFTWATRDNLPDASRVVVEIAPVNDEACELTLTHVMGPDWAAFVDKAAGSWGKMLDVLARVLT